MYLHFPPSGDPLAPPPPTFTSLLCYPLVMWSFIHCTTGWENSRDTRPIRTAPRHQHDHFKISCYMSNDNNSYVTLNRHFLNSAFLLVHFTVIDYIKCMKHVNVWASNYTQIHTREKKSYYHVITPTLLGIFLRLIQSDIHHLKWIKDENYRVWEWNDVGVVEDECSFAEIQREEKEKGKKNWPEPHKTTCFTAVFSF